MSKREIQLPEGLSADEAAEVIREYDATENPAIVPDEVVDGYELAKGVFASVLEESTPLSADALAENSMAALTEPFQDGATDTLDFETIDTLQQTPETNSGGTGTGGGSGGFDVDALSLADRTKLKRLKNKRTSFANRGIESRADTLSDEMAALADVEDADDIDWEAL